MYMCVCLRVCVFTCVYLRMCIVRREAMLVLLRNSPDQPHLVRGLEVSINTRGLRGRVACKDLTLKPITQPITQPIYVLHLVK